MLQNLTISRKLQLGFGVLVALLATTIWGAYAFFLLLVGNQDYYRSRDVQIAAREGHQLPPNSGVDRHGNPTTDPKAVLDGGALLSFGGYKGSSIGMMMEIMAAGLAGGRFSYEVDFSTHPGAATPNTAQTYIVIDPGRGAVTDFTARIEALIAEIHDAGQERLPGDRRYANRRDAALHGIPLSDEEVAMVRRYAGI